MFFWFLGLSFALVMIVFDSAALDYRLIMAGSVLPWLDRLWEPPAPMHALMFPTLVMAAVMIIGWGRRLWQRRWLGLAIGMFMHQVLSGVWSRPELFWWPGFGFRPDESIPTPGVGLAIVMEIVGIAVLVWLWKRLGLADPARRSLFVRSGRLDRAALNPLPRSGTC